MGEIEWEGSEVLLLDDEMSKKVVWLHPFMT